MQSTDTRTLVADDDIPAGIEDPTGQPATPDQIEASDQAVNGLIYIDGSDGTVCPEGSFAEQSARQNGTLVKVWVD